MIGQNGYALKMKKILFIFLVFVFQCGCTLSDPEMLEVLMEIKVQNEALQKEIDGIKSQLANLDKNYQKILESLAEDKKTIDELKNQVEALKNQINLQLDQIKNLSEQLAIQGADIEKLSKEIAELKASIAELIKKLEELLNQQNSNAFFEQNGTIKCQDAKVGDKGIVNGKQYEAVDRALLIKRRDEGADLTCVCTSLVTDMKALFGSFTVQKFTFNQPIGNWDLSNVTTMHSMFNNSTFNQPIGNWDVSKVEDMTQLFGSSPFNQPIGNWNVGRVKTMLSMFAYSDFNQPIGSWNVSNVVDMQSMFAGSPFNYPLANWNVSKVKRMSNMFAGKGNPSLWPTLVRSQFNQPIENWDVSNVENMSGMFYYSNFNQPLDNWNVSKVTDMNEMFLDSKFNQPLVNWNVENVKLMFAMFKNSQFNQNISNWCVRKVECFPGAGPCDTEPQDFSLNSPLATSFKPKWGTCTSGGSLIDRYPVGSVFGIFGPTEIVDVTNPKTGKTWMDRNLGANRAAISNKDDQAFGYLYQWGRGSDGHQMRNSETISTLSNSDQPTHDKFIIVSTQPFDWRSSRNDTLWNGENGINNPCPMGYRLPTLDEWIAEILTWNIENGIGAFNSPLKLPMAGNRNTNGVTNNAEGYSGYYWSSSAISSTTGTAAHILSFSLGDNNIGNANAKDYAHKSFGFSVRCIKD